MYESFLNAHKQPQKAVWVAREITAGLDLKKRMQAIYGPAPGPSALDVPMPTGSELMLDTISLVASLFVFGWALLTAFFGTMSVTAIIFRRTFKEMQTVPRVVLYVFCYTVETMLLLRLLHNINISVAPLSLGGTLDSRPLPVDMLAAFIVAAIMYGPFILFVIGAVITALVRRKPVFRSLVSSSLTVAIPCIGIVLLLFCAAIVTQATTECLVQNQFQLQQRLGEGQALCRENNLQWPGLTPDHRL